MKEARRLLNKAGLSLFFLVIVFSIVKEYAVFPLMSFLWKITLMTTPDGFISNANLGRTLIRSPWIVLIGIIILGGFLLFSMWQVAATVYGVAYVYEGKKIRARDILVISAKELVNGTKLRNSMMVVYIAIILPFTDLFQASEMFGAFVIPEYIQDFIYSKFYLHVLHFSLFWIAVYYAVRMIYALPAFFVKEHDFSQAGKESFLLTKKKTIKTGFRVALYNMIESIRLAILPYAFVIIVCCAVYACVSDMPYSIEIFASLPLAMARSFLKTFCGVMVYLSTMCFVVQEYLRLCKENGTYEKVRLPELHKESKMNISGRITDIAVTFLGTAGIIIIYLMAVWIVSIEPEFLEEIVDHPAVVAHKGYSSKAPENTMDAFELADKTLKTDFIELDVWSTKDGVPVVIHNETITAATGKAGNIYDYTYEELQEIPAPYAMDPALFPDARIPSLEEVISTYAKTTPLIIEIKGYHKDEQLPAKIVALMEKYNISETSMIHSGNYGALKAVKEINPDIKCGLIQAIVTGNSYDLPYADFLSVEHSFVTSQMVDQLHKRDKEIYVWTVNYKTSIDALRSYTVDGFITDYPDDIASSVRSDLELQDVFIDSIQTDGEDAIAAQKEFDNGDY